MRWGWRGFVIENLILVAVTLAFISKNHRSARGRHSYDAFPWQLRKSGAKPYGKTLLAPPGALYATPVMRVTQAGSLAQYHLIGIGTLNCVREVVKKNGLFTVRLTVRGGIGPSALTVSKCEKFGPIFPIIKW